MISKLENKNLTIILKIMNLCNKSYTLENKNLIIKMNKLLSRRKILNYWNRIQISNLKMFKSYLIHQKKNSQNNKNNNKINNKKFNFNNNNNNKQLKNYKKVINKI